MRKQAEYELYKRLKLLGEGSFGKAYLVECLQDKSLWVTKYMDLAAMTQQEKDETLREAKILEFLQHPNIVKFREVYKTKKGRLCIVMEYADGGDLGQRIKEAKGKYFQETQILDWFTQICLAIKHVHDRKIIHRDLKGQNIFLTKTGQVKLGDFGIARILKKTVEKAKTMVGTPYYISPEIIEGRPYTFMTDIWSLGVILYELCALQPPFNADSLHFLALNIVKGKYKPMPDHYSKELKTLVTQMLQVDQRRRPTIQEILKMPVITNRIKSFLSETIQKQEFSHTVLHNRAFEIKGNLNSVNLILNEQPCPPQLLQQNAKNLQEFPDIIKPKQEQEQILRPPQLIKQQPQQQQIIKQQEQQKQEPQQRPGPWEQKQIEIPKKLDPIPITKNSPIIQKKEPIPQKQQQRPRSDQEKQQQKSEPCRFDVQIQKKHSNSEQQLIPEKKIEQFVSPKIPSKIDQPRPPTAPKEKPKVNQPPQQRPQSSRPQEQKKAQKIVIEKKRPISMDKQSQEQEKVIKEQAQIRQEERIRQLKMKELQEKEKKQQQILKQQELEKQKQLEKQREIDRQKEKEKIKEAEQQQLQKEKQKELDQLFEQKPIKQFERQASQNSPRFGGGKQKDSKSNLKPQKSELVEKMQEKNKDFDLMLKELEGLLNGVNNAIDKFPQQVGKENYFDYNTMAMQPIEDREDDEDEPQDKCIVKKERKQISKEEEECLEIMGENKISTLKFTLEKALGYDKLKKAIQILQQTIEQMQLEQIEKKYGPNYEKLLPFMTQDERKKFVPLILTYIIAGV